MSRILLLKLGNITVKLVRKRTYLSRARHLTEKEYLRCDVRIHSIISSSCSCKVLTLG